MIGAQKSGTTSLHRYLFAHPQLALPMEKEAWYFNSEERLALGWEWFVREFYGGRPSAALWGKVTPQYMSDPLVPARMREVLPDVKLVALLRDPVHRAFSHWRMGVRRGREHRTFEAAVAEMIAPGTAARARTLRGESARSRCYLAWSEYGRILGQYLTLFRREQLLVVFTEDLARDPARVLDAVTEFLGLGAGYRPDNLGLRYYVGGGTEPFARLRRVVHWPPLHAVWQRVPGRIRRPLAFWMRVGAPRAGPAEEQRPDPATASVLRDWFAADVAAVRDIVGLRPPWQGFAP